MSTIEKVVIVLLLAVIAWLAWNVFVSPAHAQQVCTMRDDIVKMLGEKYQEQPAGQGIAGRSILELFVSEKGTFTFLASSPNGVSCIVAAGKDWQAEAIKKGTGL
jgi:hypothetical protein